MSIWQCEGEYPCPACGWVHNAATCITGETEPKPGDVSFCIVCCALLIFDTTGGALRLPSRDELRNAMADEGVRQAMRALDLAKIQRLGGL